MGVSVKSTISCNLGCEYCLPAGSPVLMANGTWKPIEEIKIGDVLVGFDEHSNGKQRRYRETIVTATNTKMTEGFLIHTTHGDIIASPEHKWLDSVGRWRETDNLEIGHKLQFVSIPTISMLENNDYMHYIPSEILSIKKVPEQLMYDLTTTTHTFVADGFATHNCYENSIRDAGNAAPASQYDMDAIVAESLKQLSKHPGDILTIHGGEPLLMKMEDLETLMKISYEHGGSVSMQSNGELITDEHIALFKKYNCHIGISYDGHGRLALGRWKGSEERTLKAAEKIWSNIVKLRENGVDVGIIAIITRMNGLPEQREEFKKYILDLKELGIKSGRMNPVQVDFDYLKSKFELTTDELTDFYTDVGAFTIDHGLNFTPFRDIVDSLLALNVGTCIHGGCDWYHTVGEEAILPDGEMGGCLKTAKDGVMFLRDEAGTSDERDQILRSIPMEEGGCGGCRFWELCRGICPGEGEQDEQPDWRAKSRYCKTWYSMYELYERKLKGLMPNLQLASEVKGLAPRRNGHVVFSRMLNDYESPSSWKHTGKKKGVRVPLTLEVKK